MTTTILIARHGNTFNSGDVLCRVGARTNLPLVDSGLKQGTMLGMYLSENNITLSAIFSGPLLRAQQTARNSLKAMNINLPLIITDSFDEIDYGDDDGKPEEDVRKRLGDDALKLWDEKAIVPDGWLVDPDKIISDWQKFAKFVTIDHKDTTVLVVTSNGTARFAPHLTGDFEKFHSEHIIKLSTGSLGSLTFNEDTKNWDIDYWNTKPKIWLEDHNINIEVA